MVCVLNDRIFFSFMNAIDYRHLGYVRNCVAAGLEPTDVQRLEGFSKTASSPEYGLVGRAVARVLHTVMKTAGRGTTKTGCLLEKLATADPWPTKFTPVVLGTLAAVAPMEKSAAGPLGFALASVPALYKSIALAGLGTGASLGAGHWMVDRHVRQNAPQVEGLRTKADHFARLSREIEAAMLERQLAEELMDEDYERPAKK